jgi:penicillin-binding protein 1A
MDRPDNSKGSFAPYGDTPPASKQPISRQPSSQTPRPLARKSWRGAALRIVALSSVIAGVIAAVLAGMWLDDIGVFSITEAQIAPIANVKATDNSLVYDRHGKKIGEYFDAYQVYVPFKELPKSLVNAIVAIEDRNFWQHAGYDPKGMLRAAISHLKGAKTIQGASTITQQVVRNLLLTRERSIQRKVREIALAIEVEKHVPKERLIEIYANSLFLGNGSYGVGAAAFRYFGKSVKELAPHESALIAGLFQSPSRYNPTRFPKRARARQVSVIKAMYKAKMLTFTQARQMLKRPLIYREYKPLNSQMAPYFVDYVREEAAKLLAAKKVDGQGLRIHTTIDMELQRLAEKSFEESKKLLDAAQERTSSVRGKDGKPVKATLEAALLSVDPGTGEILTMVGGRDYQKTKFNRTYQALRSPGSSFKPVVYSLALMNKWKWSDMIYVSPVTVNNYRPHTPDEDMLTETTLMRAFYRSMNTPTIELGQKIGLMPVIEHAKKLGIKSPIKEEFGSMLGSSDVTMIDLARLYGTFANQGVKVEPIAITKITDRKGKILYQAPTPKERGEAVISQQIAFLTTQGMRAVLSMGTGYTSAKLAGRAAGKTGTSNDAADNWFCGYSPNLVTIVWVGTDEHAQIRGDITGGKLALPIWDRFMTKAFELHRPDSFRMPPGIASAVVHPQFGNRSDAGVRMYFLRGQEPPIGTSASSSALESLSQMSGGSYRNVFTH